ncbi:helix-turn-helix transcriptional regulator [Micromonospora craniellae]|uniref:DNA-binding response regulator n=1 Tax=Micromonospora craniellae TaxID=2294034 RepID=A0A372FYD2_9ACTN|nr:response regulator transcription factor [Micromonospora craniellae]QOC93344.1 response regulator transcription factor [Micromonospora craniellae]RFS45792.1 DNA-binding response regulator [Micromonospora craniellae]
MLSADLSALLLSAELTDLTRTELLVVAPIPGQMPLPAEVFGELRARNLTVRLLFTPGREPLAEPVAALARDGIALRSPVDLPYFLVVRDRAVVYLPHQDPVNPGNGRLTRIRSVVMGDSLATVFGLMWDTAVQHTRAVRAAPRVDEGEELVRALGEGLTDDQAAATLHMSRRTFARRVSDMMHRLDASTRFQAGVQAARRGLV